MSTEERVARLENELSRVRYVAEKTRRTMRTLAYRILVCENDARAVANSILWDISQYENEEKGR